MKLGNIIFIARFAAIVIILFLIDFEQLVLILRSINFDLLLLAILLELAGFLIWTLKWKLIIGKLEKIKFTTLFLGLMSGNCLNTNVLRARTFGGFVIKELIMIGMYYMVGVPVTTAAVVSLIDRSIYMFFVVIIAYAATVIMRLFHIGNRM